MRDLVSWFVLASASTVACVACSDAEPQRAARSGSVVDGGRGASASSENSDDDDAGTSFTGGPGGRGSGGRGSGGSGAEVSGNGGGGEPRSDGGAAGASGAGPDTGGAGANPDPERVCTPGAFRCPNGEREPGDLEACRDDGSGFALFDECRDDEICDSEAGLCLGTECTPNAAECVGDQLHRCGSNGRVASMATCNDEQVCDAASETCA